MKTTTKGTEAVRKKNTGIPYEILGQRVFQEIHNRDPNRPIACRLRRDHAPCLGYAASGGAMRGAGASFPVLNLPHLAVL